MKKNLYGIVFASLIAIIGCGGEKDLNKDLKPIDPNIKPLKEGGDQMGGADKKAFGEKPAPILK